MKKSILKGILGLGILLAGLCANAQTTLWIPGGTNGIGNNATNNYVGIGTSTPTESFEVNGTGKFGTVVTIGNKDGNNAMLSFNAKISSDTRVIEGTTSAPTYAGQFYFGYKTGQLIYRNTASGIGTTTTWGYPFSINKSGNVGIGTLDAVAKLQVIGDAIITSKLGIGISNPSEIPSCNSLYVNGTVGAKEVRVSLTNWCDYVFEDSHKLKSLKEVESFIKTNKHLPEVPSEKEVVENGLAMGEMMKIHMKKIEELTLYMIELQKQNEKLAAEVAELKK